LEVVRVARVSGVIRQSDGSVPGSGVSIDRRITSGLTGKGLPLQPDGSFSVANLLPGDYSIRVTPTSQSRSGANARAEYARVDFTINGADLNGLVVTTAPAATFTAQIAFDEGAPPADLRPSALQFVAEFDGAALSLGQLFVNDDWTVTVREVAGTGMLRLGPTSVSGWFLKAVTIAGKDVTDTPVLFNGNQSYEDARVVLTRKHTEVSGSVIDPSRRQATDYAAVVFAEDRARWTARSRFIAVGRPDQQGQFKVTGLPPGRYLAVAVEALASGQERDPELLERLAAAATSLTLAEGESRTLTLTMTN
jgi:hypothetical protein